MVESAINDVGNGFEATMRVPRSALGLTRCVLHLAHLIHHDEGISIFHCDASKGASHWEAFAFKTLRSSSDATKWP